jgi:hypothetical protein
MQKILNYEDIGIDSDPHFLEPTSEIKESMSACFNPAFLPAFSLMQSEYQTRPLKAER